MEPTVVTLRGGAGADEPRREERELAARKPGLDSGGRRRRGQGRRKPGSRISGKTGVGGGC